ncbi:MAG: glycoside hydrolase family 2 TIM barrel-domain containing protein [Patescibacteria group bacterium]
MLRQNLDRGWGFSVINGKDDWWNPIRYDRTVDLPHDWSIELGRDRYGPEGPNVGYFKGGIGRYEKVLHIPEEWRGRHVLLEFEGVYMLAEVHLNNQLVGRNPYGYTGFHCDLTPHLRYGGENIIRVTANNTGHPNSRWYSGSGIYRHVWLMVGDAVHITPWGVYVTTPAVSTEASTVAVRTTVENTGGKDARVVVRSAVLDAGGREAAATAADLFIPAGGTAEAAQTLSVAPARLWSLEDPYLYTMKSEIHEDGKVIDTALTTFGIRAVSFSAERGFELNGVGMKLRGGCVHHDCGPLGAAAHDRAEERKVEILKKAGYNAVRTAHNPPSPAFLDACDRLGLLVMDEFFDGWVEPRPYLILNDYHNYFTEWWERDLRSIVLRDRNHPSIVLWSLGNEVVERDGRSDGYAWARKLADFVRGLDGTRGITNGIASIHEDPLEIGKDPKTGQSKDFDYFGELSREFIAPLDVAGYNYEFRRYDTDGAKFPGRVIVGTESNPKHLFDNWEAIGRNPNVIGDFVWTSLDYLGESGIGRVEYDMPPSYMGAWPWHHAYCGDFDLCGFKRTRSSYREIVWGLRREPFMAVYKPEHHGRRLVEGGWAWSDTVEAWTFPGWEGKPTRVDVYSPSAEVELRLNGRSLGRKPAGRANRFLASFDLVYEPGELLAVGYEGGVEVSRHALRTTGAPAALRVAPDRDRLAGWGDLSFVTVEVVDADGARVPYARHDLLFTIDGVGSIAAVGNGDPQSEEPYVGNRRKAHEGRALVVIKAGQGPGVIEFTASADGLPTARAMLAVGGANEGSEGA